MMVERALEAARELAPAIDVEVIDLRNIYPFDLDQGHTRDYGTEETAYIY